MNNLKYSYFTNLVRDMNFSCLKKTFTNIFTDVKGFWIFTGIAFLVLMTLLFACISPLSNRFNKSYSELDDLLTVLEKYALKKDFHNDKWVASKKREATLYDKEIEKCKAILKGKDEMLESGFSIEDPQKGPVKVEDVALWKREYLKKVSVLLAKLEANNIATSEGALPFQTWGSDIPTRDTILPAQKRFRILETIANIAMNNGGITRLKKITFRESPYTYDPSFAQLYTVIPFTIKIELRAERIKFLLHEILKSDIPFVLEGITISGTGKIFNPSPLMESEYIMIKDTNDHQSNPIIDVTIDAYVIDYKT